MKSFDSMLLLIFITLKLTGNIDWSWWWVLSPAWFGMLTLLLMGVLVTVAQPKDRL